MQKTMGMSRGRFNSHSVASTNQTNDQESVSSQSDTPIRRLLRLSMRLIDAIVRRSGRQGKLAVVERIALGPRHQLALIEVEGVRVLVATSPASAPTFFTLPGYGGGATTDEDSAASQAFKFCRPPVFRSRASW